MKKTIPTLIVAVVVVVIAAVFIRRPGSDPDAVNADEHVAKTTETARPVRESVVENSLSSVKSEPVEKAVEASLSDMQATMLMKVEAIQQDSDYKEREGMLFDLMLDASMEEVMELLALSEEQNTYSQGLRNHMKVAAYERWYQLDPAAALLAMDASTLTSSIKNSRMEVFLQDWAERSPQDVAAFLEQGQLTGVSSDLTYGALVRGSALNGDLEVVDAALARMGDPKLRSYALRAAARALQRDHADQFEGWLNTLPVEEQNKAIAEGAWMLADKNIDGALAGLDRLAEQGADELAVTRSRILVKWARNDPARAGAWVVEQEISGEEREDLFSTLLSVWVREDRSAAIAWIENLIADGEIDDAFMNRVITRM